MEIVDENVSRKLDYLGRVSIPVGLRNRYGFMPGNELEFSTLAMGDKDYVLISKRDDEINPKYLIAYNALRELGCEIPKKLGELVGA